MTHLDHITLFAQVQDSGGAGGPLGAIICLAIAILVIAGFWKTFEKAGKPGAAPGGASGGGSK